MDGMQVIRYLIPLIEREPPFLPCGRKKAMEVPPGTGIDLVQRDIARNDISAVIVRISYRMMIGLPESKIGDKQHTQKPGYEEACFHGKNFINEKRQIPKNYI